MNAVELLQKLLNENNLIIQLTPMKVRTLEDGAVLIEKPEVVVNFKESEVKDEQGSEKTS